MNRNNVSRPRALPFPLPAWLRLAAMVLLGAGVLVASLHAAQSAESDAMVVPAPAFDDKLADAPGSRTLTLAGGCFWGVQGVYQHLKGVKSAVSGYAGGERGTASYPTVSGGDTGHAESVQIVYDPSVVTAGQLLQVFFSVVHDPTQLNRQGADRGTQYRSAIFPADAQQRQIAERYIAQLNQARLFPGKIVTRLDAYQGFYPAEAYHQDYLTLHPNQPYIAINDLPKVANLQKLFPALYREQPVLVGGAG